MLTNTLLDQLPLRISSHNSTSLASSTHRPSPNSSSQSATSAPTTPPPTLKRRRHPTALFGKTPFKFNLSRHRRASSGETERSRRTSTSSVSSCEEHISPTTTISPSPHLLSSPCNGTSSEKENDLGFPFGKAAGPRSARGRSLGSVDEKVPLSPKMCKDVHPGTLVTIPSLINTESYIEYESDDDYDDEDDDNDNENDDGCAGSCPCSSQDDYHRFLREEKRDNERVKRSEDEVEKRERTSDGPTLTAARSHKSSNATTIETTIYPIPHRLSSSSRKQSMDYKTRKLLTQARIEGQQAQMKREGCETERTNESISSSRSSSANAEDFLRHVRQSVEARQSERRKKASYNIFKDESENGFLEGSI